jgi:hypothetical protein
MEKYFIYGEFQLDPEKKSGLKPVLPLHSPFLLRVRNNQLSYKTGSNRNSLYLFRNKSRMEIQ